MNRNIAKLYQIAQKTERKIIGLMSGTSMDGLDIALCECKNSGAETEIKLLNFITMAYQDDFRADVKSIFSRKDADLEKAAQFFHQAEVQEKQIDDRLTQLAQYEINFRAKSPIVLPG